MASLLDYNKKKTDQSRTGASEHFVFRFNVSYDTMDDSETERAKSKIGVKILLLDRSRVVLSLRLLKKKR